MAKKEPPKNKPPVRFPTGTTKTFSNSVNSKTSTHASSPAVKSKSNTDSLLAGSTAQTTLPPLAQDPYILTLAKQIETPNSQTLATKSISVPGNQDQPAAAPKAIEPSSRQASGSKNPSEL
ncbi:hypothetical protein F2Q69_00001691 [Brassica cretica]|uniref:Uncharacterized protein n=1 Tax=Brassica cretica TaxID=69181 RepID=A0A8S9NST1_BRACR|nr:hypothetical protein F2Q69_00001691 [Brassica cretica]